MTADSRIRTVLLTLEYRTRSSYYLDWAEAFSGSPLFDVTTFNVFSRGQRRAARRAIEGAELVVALHACSADTLEYLKPLAGALQRRRGRFLVFVGNEYNLPWARLADKRDFSARDRARLDRDPAAAGGGKLALCRYRRPRAGAAARAERCGLSPRQARCGAADRYRRAQRPLPGLCRRRRAQPGARPVRRARAEGGPEDGHRHREPARPAGMGGVPQRLPRHDRHRGRLVVSGARRPYRAGDPRLCPRPHRRPGHQSRRHDPRHEPAPAVSGQILAARRAPGSRRSATRRSTTAG